jgi:hypothetical protein
MIDLGDWTMRHISRIMATGSQWVYEIKHRGLH